MITSAGRLHRDWLEASRARTRGEAGRTFAHRAAPGRPFARAALVSVVNGHPAALSWLGAVSGHRVVALGVDRFGQSGDIPDLYREYGLDSSSIVAAAAQVCLDQLPGDAQLRNRVAETGGHGGPPQRQNVQSRVHPAASQSYRREDPTADGRSLPSRFVSSKRTATGAL